MIFNNVKKGEILNSPSRIGRPIYCVLRKLKWLSFFQTSSVVLVIINPLIESFLEANTGES